jgi:hypothetical protein
MCIIVETKPSIPVVKDLVKEFCRINSDGWGLMCLNESGEVDVQRGFGWRSLWHAYKATAHLAPWIHCRMATHGAVNLDMTHPFEVLPGTWLMHNGVVDAFADDDAYADALYAWPSKGGAAFKADPNAPSDTAKMVRECIAPLLAEARDAGAMLRSDAFRTLFENLLGIGNRVVVMDRHGAVVFNEHQWSTPKTLGYRVSNLYAWKHPVHNPPKITPVKGATPVQASATGETISDATKAVVGKLLQSAAVYREETAPGVTQTVTTRTVDESACPQCGSSVLCAPCADAEDADECGDVDASFTLESTWLNQAEALEDAVDNLVRDLPRMSRAEVFDMARTDPDVVAGACYWLGDGGKYAR